MVLAASAVTDWLDGKLARLLNQYSRLGAVLDPVADRLYILATLFAFVVRGILPWWVAALIVGRDVVLALAPAGDAPARLRPVRGALPRQGRHVLPALRAAAAAARPARRRSLASPSRRPLALAFTGWGVLLYLWAGALYLRQVVWVVRNTPVVPADRSGSTSAASPVSDR